MSRIKIENNQLVITMQGARKFFALKSEIAVPLENVESVETGLKWKDMPNVLDKIAGTNADMFYYGGYFRQDGDRVFYDLKKREEALVISLKDGDFHTLVIGVENPDETLQLIEQAIKQ
ncbi:MAG: hypothetical protein FWD06_04195 [Oscillospiraceae bacterium]|nr:hypothetical protein [Oscillospiraceae bacterium]